MAESKTIKDFMLEISFAKETGQEENPWKNLVEHIQEKQLAEGWGLFADLLTFAPLRLTDRDDVCKVVDGVRDWRSPKNKEESFPQKIVVFLVLPPFYDQAQRFARLRVKKRSGFKKTEQAVFCAELIPGEDNGFVNIVTFADLVNPDEKGKKRISRLAEACGLINKNKKWYFKWLGTYYETFVNFYELLKYCSDDDIERLNNCDAVRMELNGIDSNTPHAITLEPFRAPIPFIFYELFAARSEVLERLRGSNQPGKLNFLWIDNKPFDGNGKKNELISLLEDGMGRAAFSLSVLAKPTGDTLGAVPLQSEAGDNIKDIKNIKAPSFPIDDDAQKAEILSLCKEKAHFILLDFFLDSADTYLAFDFIKEIDRIKRQNNDNSTTWYFITSAVHDSVTRYAQSGLLAEYYESAVVNAGDDPTNDKRKSIFLYKLLTFINARMNSVLRHFDLVRDTFFMKGKQVCRECCGAQVGAEKIRQGCFRAVQRGINRFLAEEASFAAMVVGGKYERQREVFSLLNNTIDKFRTLPRADWQMVQRQIDFIRNELHDMSKDLPLKERRDFSCGHILKEMEERSEQF